MSSLDAPCNFKASVLLCYLEFVADGSIIATIRPHTHDGVMTDRVKHCEH